MTSADADDGPAGPPRPPVWKEPPFLAGVVVLVGLAAAIGLLSLLERGDGAQGDRTRMGQLDPAPVATPFPQATPALPATPAPSPTPGGAGPTPTPSPTGEPSGPRAPELPDEGEPEVVRGQGPQAVEATGRGPGRTPVVEHEGGVAIIRLAHAGEGTFRAELIDPRGVRVELDGAAADGSALVEAEGRYDGSRALVLEEGRYRVAVTADGTWGARWVQPRYQRAPDVPVTRSAPADAATRPFTVSGSSVEIAWSVEGGDVAARVLNVAGHVAAEVTAADGETTTVSGLGGGLYLLDVRADDRWRAEVR